MKTEAVLEQFSEESFVDHVLRISNLQESEDYRSSQGSRPRIVDFMNSISAGPLIFDPLVACLASRAAGNTIFQPPSCRSYVPMKSRLSKRSSLFFAPLAACAAAGLYFHFFTPRDWRWNTANLQVHIHSSADSDSISGRTPWNHWNESGFGWRKRDLFLFGWLWRDSSGSDQHGGSVSTRTRIIGVTPSGVSVRIVHHESRGETFSFDKTVFVTADAPSRIDVSGGLYIAAYFELGPDQRTLAKNR